MKIKYIFILFVLITGIFLSPSTLKANTITSVYSYGGTGYDTARWIVKTKKGEFVIVGNSTSSNGDFKVNRGGQDLFITKLDSNGNKMWLKSYGGSGLDYVFNATNTQDGGVVAVGVTNSTNGDIPPNKGDYDAIIIKLDHNGNKLWMKTFGGSYYDEFGKVIETQDGHYIAIGQSSSTNGDVTGNKGNYDGIMVKYDSIGNKIWTKNYGGSNNDGLSDVIELENRQLILVGNSYSNNGDLSSNKGSADGIIVKTDSLGNLMWSKNYGGLGSDYFSKIKKTQDGPFLVAGGSRSSDGDLSTNKGADDIIVGKFDELGNKIWLKNYGGNNADGITGLIETNKKDILVSGNTTSTTGDFQPTKGSYDVLQFKIDYNGNIIWNKTFGTTLDDFNYNAIETTSYKYVFTTTSYSTSGDFGTTKGQSDFKLVTFNETPYGQQNNIAVGIKSGEFTIEQPLLEANLGTITIDGEIHNLNTSLSNVTIKDFRATGEGWNVTVSASPFQAVSDPTILLPTNTLTLEPIDSIQWKVGDTNLPTSDMAFPMTIDNGSVKIASSDAGEGTGEYELIFPNQALKLTVDTSTVKIDDSLGTTEFESIITWSLTTGP